MTRLRSAETGGDVGVDVLQLAALQQKHEHDRDRDQHQDDRVLDHSLPAVKAMSG
jgi:hypothetical protein